MTTLTGILWCEIQMIDTPTSKRHARQPNSDCDQSHGKRCIAVNVSRGYKTCGWQHKAYNDKNNLKLVHLRLSYVFNYVYCIFHSYHILCVHQHLRCSLIFNSIIKLVALRSHVHQLNNYHLTLVTVHFQF